MTFFNSRRAPQEDTSFDDLVSSGRIWQCPTVSRIRGIVGTRQLLPAVGLPQFIRNWVSPIVKDRLRHLTSPPAPLSRLERGSTTANFARTSPLSASERGCLGGRIKYSTVVGFSRPSARGEVRWRNLFFTIGETQLRMIWGNPTAHDIYSDRKPIPHQKCRRKLDFAHLVLLQRRIGLEH